MSLRVFHPVSTQAFAIQHLFYIALAVCAFILLVVTGALVWIMWRYRSRGGPDPKPMYGNRPLEIGWTVVPFLLLAMLFGFSFAAADAVDQPVRQPDIIVRGHQWWWEATYPNSKFTTANEIHIPAERDVLLRVETADVIHDFWVPEVTRKVDAIPNLTNYVWAHVNRPGTYLGACAEFCGAEHAWMRFEVIAESEYLYDRWLERQERPAAAPSAENARLGAQLFQELTCSSCHNITGTDADAKVGPDLTHFASRRKLASGRLVNTAENVARWLEKPQEIKPGCHMPNLQLSNRDVTELTAYLESLQ